MSGRALTREELSQLLYLESCATERGGMIEGARMNDADFHTVKRWSIEGFVQFGRIAANDIDRSSVVITDHWRILSEEAWQLAHAERRARCARRMDRLKVRRKGLPHDGLPEVSDTETTTG